MRICSFSNNQWDIEEELGKLDETHREIHGNRVLGSLVSSGWFKGKWCCRILGPVATRVLFFFCSHTYTKWRLEVDKVQFVLRSWPTSNSGVFGTFSGKNSRKGVHAQQLQQLWPGALISHKLWRNPLVINLGNTWQYKILKVTKFGISLRTTCCTNA